MFDIQDELKKLPDKPGVYIMKDENADIIYVGKAVVLKNRVRQYFQMSSNHTEKVRAMVSRIKEFEYIVTNSELEALILECNLIKKYKPKYNILLKDDKNYPYIKVTLNEEYPRILMTRRVEKDGAKYFGPYSNYTAVKETIEHIKKTFPLKTCNKVLPRDIGKERPCLNYHIFQCMAPCQGDINKEVYRSVMKDICLFLGGHQEEVISKLEQQMKTAAENMEFEKAASIRNKINNLKHIAEKQKVLSADMEDQDVISLVKGKTDACIQIFFIRGGKLIGREHFIFAGEVDTPNNELEASFVKQFYGSADFIPEEIIMQDEIEDSDVVENWLSEKRSKRVHIRVPKKGEKRKLVEMVSENAMISLRQFEDNALVEGAVTREGLSGFASVLGLENEPERIEAYDISNTGSSEIVASMVVFEDGKPAKKEYRKFKIKTIDLQDDYASMREVISRRFRHAQKEEAAQPGSDKAKFSKLPDIILLDGGIGHVNAVRPVIEELNIKIPLFGMVKDENHRTRGLVSDNKEITLSNNLPVLRFVTSIQDEAHRFAIEYNRKLREKRYTRSVLDDIEGIGPKKKKALLKHFGSVNRIKAAGVDDLEAVEGINKPLAEKICEFFRS
ncbi:MAG: excinuclease ABC subunit UvrC [Bacillota bacterium]|nr:excinuclease ABC subunit UvrC [Bacillota bacterium]